MLNGGLTSNSAGRYDTVTKTTFTIALTVVTALMAVGTFILAWYTRALAKDTAEGIKQSDRRHQEDLRPFCVIDFRYPTGPDPFGIDRDSNQRFLDAIFRKEQTPPPSDTIVILGELRNKGRGLAKDVVVYLNKRLGDGEEGAYRLTRPVVVSGLIGGEEVMEIAVPVTVSDIMPVRDSSGWRPMAKPQAIVNEVYEVALEYKDVFENVFRTVHPRGFWREIQPNSKAADERAMQNEMMAGNNKPTPIFLTGKRAMQTAADIRMPIPQIHESDPQ